METEIEIEVWDHASAHGLDGSLLRRQLVAALPHVLALPAQHGAVLAELEGVEVSLVSDAAIAQVHGEFLGNPSATDVITFHHGEILISVETAARACVEHGLSLAAEVALYGIHGLLHLHGFDDHEPAAAAAMREAQERILKTVLEAVPVR